MPSDVLFICLDWQKDNDDRTGLGAACIVANLQAEGIRAHCITAPVNAANFCLEDVIDRAQAACSQLNPNPILAISCWVWNKRYRNELASALRPLVGQIVVGGPDVSYQPKGHLEVEFPWADLMVRGAGERAMAAIAQGRSRSFVGIHHHGEVDRGLVADSDVTGLPSPYTNNVLPVGHSVRWETHRNCAFRCTFCQHRSAGRDRSTPEFDKAKLVSELDMFVARDVTRITILDPIFNQDRERAIWVLDEIRARLPKCVVNVQLRPEMVDDGFVQAARGMKIEAELGIQTAIKAESDAVKRFNNPPQIKQGIESLLRAGVSIQVSLMYGLPLQTVASFRSSIEWVRNLGVTNIVCYALRLHAGTELEQDRDRFNLAEEKDAHGLDRVVRSSTFSEADFRCMDAIARTVNEARLPSHLANAV